MCSHRRAVARALGHALDELASGPADERRFGQRSSPSRTSRSVPSNGWVEKCCRLWSSLSAAESSKDWGIDVRVGVQAMLAPSVAAHGSSRIRPANDRRSQEITGTAGASNAQVRGRFRASPLVAKSAQRTLSRWRHGFEPRCDHQKERRRSRLRSRSAFTFGGSMGASSP
jgi:hypothetical protein